MNRHFRRSYNRVTGGLASGTHSRNDALMLELDDQQQAARDWFESLRDRICSTFEQIEREAGSDAAFVYSPWDRTDVSGEAGGGGIRGQMIGKVFDKVDPDRMQQMWTRMRPMPVDAFAEKSLRDVAKNKPVIVWPMGGKLFWWIDRLSPSLCIKMARDMYDSNQRLMQHQLLEVWFCAGIGCPAQVAQSSPEEAAKHQGQENDQRRQVEERPAHGIKEALA